MGRLFYQETGANPDSNEESVWDCRPSDHLLTKLGLRLNAETGELLVEGLASELARVDPWGMSRIVSEYLHLRNSVIVERHEAAKAPYKQWVEDCVKLDRALSFCFTAVKKRQKYDRMAEINHPRLKRLRRAFIGKRLDEMSKPLLMPLVRPYFSDTGTINPNKICIVEVDPVIFNVVCDLLKHFNGFISYALPAKQLKDTRKRMMALRQDLPKRPGYNGEDFKDAFKEAEHLKPDEYLSSFQEAASLNERCPKLRRDRFRVLISWNTSAQPKIR